MVNVLAALSEIVLTFAGGLLFYLAVTGAYWVDRKSPVWIGLAAFLVLRGLRSFWTASRAAGRSFLRWQQGVRGTSLLAVGGLMLAAAGLAASDLQPLMAAAGGILILRGLANAALALRSR